MHVIVGAGPVGSEPVTVRATRRPRRRTGGSTTGPRRRDARDRASTGPLFNPGAREMIETQYQW